MRRDDVTTAEQLLVLDDPPWRHELVRGELGTAPPGGYWHGAVTAHVAGALGSWTRQHTLGQSFLGTGFVLARDPDTVLAPDVAFVVATRMPTRLTEGFLEGPPDLAVEVSEPDEPDHAVGARVDAWLAHGARAVWVVDPCTRTVTVRESGSAAVRTFRDGDELDGGTVLPGFRVAVRTLFPDDGERAG
jgi:Uma2 family endonuclease